MKEDQYRQSISLERFKSFFEVGGVYEMNFNRTHNSGSYFTFPQSVVFIVCNKLDSTDPFLGDCTVYCKLLSDNVGSFREEKFYINFCNSLHTSHYDVSSIDVQQGNSLFQQELTLFYYDIAFKSDKLFYIRIDDLDKEIIDSPHINNAT